MRNKLYYLVEWLGYIHNDRTWKPMENVANAPQLLEEFHHIYHDEQNPCSRILTRGTGHQRREIIPEGPKWRHKLRGRKFVS
jgi:hypothetical protein